MRALSVQTDQGNHVGPRNDIRESEDSGSLPPKQSEPERDEGRRRTRDSRGARIRKWIIGLIGAAIVAALSTLIAGWFSSATKSVGGLVGPSHSPVDVVASLDSNGSWVVPYPPERLKYPSGPHGESAVWEKWARTYGGSEDSTNLRVVVVGRSDRAVVLTGLQIDVVARKPVPRGTRALLTAGGGIPTRYFSVDLDDPSLKVSYTNGEDNSVTPVRFPYRVSSSEPEVFFLGAYTKRCDCRWIARLDWVAGGKTGSTVIDDHGRPFRTISPAKSVDYYVGGGSFHRLQSATPGPSSTTRGNVAAST